MIDVWYPRHTTAASPAKPAVRQVPFRDLLNRCQQSAVHLETRDRYCEPMYQEWKAGRRLDVTEGYRNWHELIRATVARGVSVRRARVVSEPVTDYIRFEYQVTTALNVGAGEQVRWLPRRRASELLLPGNDFWVFDEQLVRFGHFDGYGEHLYDELTDEPGVVRLCLSAFEEVWTRATDHGNYRPG
jgi:hypothetical protein